ncbi:HTTM domain-containing protein [Rubinisphaera sp.]|mgnify:FL=1|uniref:HTTM domain-containing protein n=1 Tax=Rubinisphaera sp. TaxID=2024857 RepID=UPI0025E332E3|nr:HTTM domain-containing protein [Rubinisphaera sp.]
MGRTVQILERECRNYIGQVSKTWTEFWFIPRDPFSMSVMRILVGWMVFYTTLIWGMRLEAFFNVDGFNSMEMINKNLLTNEGPFAFSFWYWVPEAWVYPVHYLSLAITFCFMIGLYTRVTSILSLIVVISYAYRARYANYGLDQINAILTLYLCIAPSGAYLSVDRWLKKRRAADGVLPVVQPTLATNIATRMTQLHYCVIYLAAGTGKLFGDTWWDGSAMWRGFANAEYQSFDLTWLAYFQPITEMITHTTIAWELSFAFLVWRPLARPIILLMGAGMHFGIGLFMGMWTFGFCMMFGYVTFLDPIKFKHVLEYFCRTSFGESALENPDSLAESSRKHNSKSPLPADYHQGVLLDRNPETSQKTIRDLKKQGYETAGH